MPAPFERLLQTLTRWDAIYFASIAERGYVFEQEWAFGWGFTRLLSFLGTCTLIFLASFPPHHDFNIAALLFPLQDRKRKRERECVCACLLRGFVSCFLNHPQSLHGEDVRRAQIMFRFIAQHGRLRGFSSTHCNTELEKFAM
jgi:hypothetical protein